MSAEEARSALDTVTSLHGVTLEQYAGVRAALTEELPLNAILANEDLDPAVWPKADAAWKQRLAEDGPQGALFQAYCEKLGEAEDWLVRGVTPLDDDLEAWLSFLHAWSESATPFELLKSAGLRMNDVSRLQRRWARRLAEDAALQKRAAEMAKKDPGPMPTIHTDVAELKTFPWSKGRKPLPALRAEIPSEGDADAFGLDRYAALAAELAHGPSDRSRVLDHYGLTPSAFEALDRRWKQRFKGDVALERDYRGLYEHQRARLRVVSRQSESETAPLRDVPSGPALPFARAEGAEERKPADAPGQIASTAPLGELRKRPILPFAEAPEPRKSAQSAAAAPDEHASAGRNETAPLLDGPRRPALPFEAQHPEAAAPAPKPVPAPDKPAETAPIGDVPRGPALPFSTSAEPSPESAKTLPRDLAGVRPPEELLGRALTLDDPSRSLAPSGHAPEVPPVLTLEQHASLWVELAKAPKRTAETLARYRLTRAQKRQADRYWQKQMAKDPEIRAAWYRSYEIYSRWLSEHGRGKG